MNISSIHAREILDSKGEPTLEVEVTLADGTTAVAGVPSGASTGTTEAHELRDNDESRFAGKGVLQAVQNVNGPLATVVSELDAFDQEMIDQALIEADGTDNKSKYGGNAILGVSAAICKAAAHSQNQELFQYFGELSDTPSTQFTLPQPMILILEGGKHGNWATDIQEFMVVPLRQHFPTFAQRLQAGAEIFHSMKKILVEAKYSIGVGFEGAFAPRELSSNEEAFELLSQAVTSAGYAFGEEIVLAVDVAASEFYHEGQYLLASENNTAYSTKKWAQQLLSWSQFYNIWSIEDPFAEESWGDWAEFHQLLKNSGQTNTQLVGDDLLTTNVQRIAKGVEQDAINSVLIKPNQIGTITETIKAIRLSQDHNLSTVISHRGGETNDDLIADLAVGTAAGQCKFGGPDRGERLAKYNRLLKIEEQL